MWLRGLEGKEGENIKRIKCRKQAFLFLAGLGKLCVMFLINFIRAIVLFQMDDEFYLFSILQL